MYKILKKSVLTQDSANSPERLFNKGRKNLITYSLCSIEPPYRNSEIFVSALLEYLKIPYLGSTPNIRALAEDKHLAKIVAKAKTVLTPLTGLLLMQMIIFLFQSHFKGPFFIKPRFGASSAYIDESSMAFTWICAKKRIYQLQQAGLDVIVERFVDGIYYSVPVYFKNNQIN